MKLVVFFILFVSSTDCVNILCVFFGPSISHQVIFQPIWKELSLRGHNVTVISPNILNDNNLVNLTEIDISFMYQIKKKYALEKVLYFNNFVVNTLNNLDAMTLDLMYGILDYKPVRNLLNNKDVKFDLVIVQHTHFMHMVHGFAYRYQVPVVGISTLSLFLHSHDALGNPTHPVISPDMMMNFAGEITFFDKLNSFLYNIWYRIYYYYYLLPKSDQIARKYFGNDMPYLGDLENNMSLILVNVNPIMQTVRPNVPNIIEINQMHITKEKPLPKDIQEYLDSSPQGVVYFSLGSNIESSALAEKTIKEILGALSDLPYKVLWKWESDYLPGQPKNVMTRKWLPQQDILRHPNVKVFVTQGGFQSIEEAITYEVPMVGIPFITDQPSNIKRIVDLGMGLEIDHRTFKRDDLKNAILEVATNKKFRREIKKSRDILTDQPLLGVDKAIWWIEYVIRHKGARHLRSPAADMSFFQYFMIDVIAFLIICTISFLWSLLKVYSLLRRYFSKQFTKKIKKN